MSVPLIMPADLQVLADPSPYSLADISDKLNTNKTHRIVSDAFLGATSLQIRHFPTHHRTTSSEYFKRLDRQGVTWSIQVQRSGFDHFCQYFPLHSKSTRS